MRASFPSWTESFRAVEFNKLFFFSLSWNVPRLVKILMLFGTENIVYTLVRMSTCGWTEFFRVPFWILKFSKLFFSISGQKHFQYFFDILILWYLHMNFLDFYLFIINLYYLLIFYHFSYLYSIIYKSAYVFVNFFIFAQRTFSPNFHDIINNKTILITLLDFNSENLWKIFMYAGDAAQRLIRTYF